MEPGEQKSTVHNKRHSVSAQSIYLSIHPSIHPCIRLSIQSSMAWERSHFLTLLEPLDAFRVRSVLT